MKISLFVLSATFLVTACNSNPKAIATTTDTTVAAEAKLVTAAPVVVKKTATRETTTTNATASPSAQMSSESDNAAKAKTGWSKTAKGAVIGGVVGAGTGAVVHKRNRVAGAVVGGAVGAGTGAVIGNEMDKKDGRH